MSESRCSDLETIHYLPRFAKRAKQAKVRQIGYSVDRDPITARITFNYNIAWTDVDDSLVSRYEVLKTNMTKKTAKGGRDDPAVVLPRLIQCDGACNAWAPEDYIIQFGLCDHNICFRCYENEESIALTNDGTRGCCNKECVARAKAELALRTPNLSPKSSAKIALGSSSRYRTYPGTKKKANLQRNIAKQPATQSMQLKKAGGRGWKWSMQDMNSDVSFFGDYDDAKLQEMAETMRSAAIEDGSQNARERQIC
ncbi:hypothetical protein ANCCAN_05733 [Ancylostoma caninum]|uniref:Uncharacterized protein n=1 Tax=Ancylostoma caninum TaxID=29170 RepID=A0A368GX86_ANCCA|nr:hypothetical protein ANCCAN_05733 [Ancylostoma caninum]